MVCDDVKRLHNTCLTDSELILFDAIFDCAYPLRLLRDDMFQEVFNMNYSHSFNDKQLIECLNNLVMNGLLLLDGVKLEALCVSHLYESFNTSIYIQLTGKGGELWELERDPDWNLYCMDSDDGKMFRVTSPSLETAQRFFETAHECHFSSFAINERAIERRQNEQLIS